MNVLNALNWRYAVRKFSNKSIANDKLKQLVEATRLSASSYGLQPYKILLVRSKDIRQQLLAHSYGQEKVAQSPLLIVLASHTNIGDHTVDRYVEQYQKVTGQEKSTIAGYADHMKSALSSKSEQQKQQWAHQQSYIALGNLLTSAALLQIDTCPMTGFDAKGYDLVLKLNEQGLTASVICAVGYRDQSDQSADRAKVRFDHQEMVAEI